MTAPTSTDASRQAAAVPCLCSPIPTDGSHHPNCPAGQVLKSRQAAEDAELAKLKAIQVQAKSREFMAAANRLPTLFDLGDEALRLMAILECGDPETEAEDIAQLALIDQMMVEKVESYVSVIRSMEALADAREVEEHRLRDTKQTARRHADWLKNRLLVHMQTVGPQRIETARFTLALRKNPPSCVVVDAAAVPSEFERTKITIDVDKRAVLEHYKATGEIVAGVEISSGQSLRIS